MGQKLVKITGSIDDERLLKNLKNFHRKTMKKTQKEYYQKKIQNNFLRWKTINNLKENDDKSLRYCTIEGKEVTSPQKLADGYIEHLLNKLEKIKNTLPKSSIVAEKIFKKLIPEAQTEFQFKTVKSKQIYEIINKLPNTNSRGNDQITN